MGVKIFSQICHNYIPHFSTSHYCAIDDLSLLYENMTDEVVNIRNDIQTQSMVNEGILKCITYSHAIDKISEFILTLSNEFVIGYTKATEGNINSNASLTHSSSLSSSFTFIQI